MSRSAHLKFEIILDYVQELLPTQERAEIAAHLVECSQCRQQFTQAQELISFLQDDAVLEIGRKAHQKAVDLFRPWLQTRQAVRPGAETGLGMIIRRVRANLLLDSRQELNLLGCGLRAAGLGQPFQLLYSVDEGRVEVDLQLRPATDDSGRLEVIGQVLGCAGTERNVELVPLGGGSSLQVQADATFTFRFPIVQSGEYRLNVNDGLETVEISSVKL